MADAFEMLQSRTFVQQFGYGLLKIGLVNMFPELKALFRKIERSAQEPSKPKETTTVPAHAHPPKAPTR